MKEIPILFSTPMVQAILEGRKTQTRRVVKGEALKWLEPDMFTPEFVANPENSLCPYGQPGDLLWVRETWINQDGDYKFLADNLDWKGIMKFKPSIYMPKEAARIWLKVVNVRVERLQEISEQDAIAEGVETLGLYPGYSVSSRGKFEGLWNHINGAESWDANPWVWVVEFEVLSTTGRPCNI